jgi:signal transduction histidine kinase
VEADRARLIQVISNLLNNAIKFSKTGAVLVTLKKKVNSKEVIVCINDNGPGIDPAILPRLFEKFATKSEKVSALASLFPRQLLRRIMVGYGLRINLMGEELHFHSVCQSTN